jgi:hypothetical protein
LDSIAVSEDEKDAVFESVLSNYDIEFSKFMARIHRLENLLDEMIEVYVSSPDSSRRQPIIMKIRTLQTHGVINEKQAHIMDMARRVRNRLVHNDFDIRPNEVVHVQTMLEELTGELESGLRRHES